MTNGKMMTNSKTSTKLATSSGGGDIGGGLKNPADAKVNCTIDAHSVTISSIYKANSIPVLNINLQERMIL